MKNLISFFITFILGTILIHAALQRQPEFKSVTGMNGIPMSGITSMTIDNDGFIWAASRMGIMRAIPSDCRVYDLPVSTSDVMQVKLGFNKGILAVITQNGQVFRYNRINDRFEQWFSLVEFLGSKEWVTNLAIDNYGKVWISTSIGVFIYSGDKPERLEEDKRGYSYIVPIDGNLFFAVIDSEFFKIDTKTSGMSKIPGSFSQLISSAVYDSYNKTIWIGTYQGELWDYSLQNNTLSQPSGDKLPELIIRSLLVEDGDNLLVGMEGGGIIVLDSKSRKIKNVVKDNIDNPASIKGNSVFAMLNDNQQRLWTATTSGGLQYADTESDYIEHMVHKLNNPSSLHNNEVNYVMTDKDGNLWVATNDGISCRHVTDGEWTHYYGGRELSVLSITQDRDGRIYASTFGKGVYVLDSTTGRELDHFTEEKGSLFGNGSFVFASMTDSDGDVWFGGVKGPVICYSPSKRSFREYDQYPVFCIAEGSDGEILTGGGEGVIAINKENGKSEPVLIDNVVQHITVDGNTLWLCTSGNGILAKNRHTGMERAFTTQDGLHSNFARSMIRTGDKLWIGTAQGMSCFNLKDSVMLPLPGKDLLTRSAFRENSSCQLPDGTVAFGTNNGIIAFQPERVADLEGKGRIFFSDIRVSGRSIRGDSDPVLSVPIDSLCELRLNYPRNSFTLSVLPLGNVGSNVGYSWRLEGLDKDWSEISSMAFINYINLKPGKYTLQVRMYDGGFISERSLKVRVTPPFWQTGWFRMIVIALMIGVLGLLVRHYIWRMHRRYTFEKIRFYTRMAHDLRSSLMLIKAPLGELRREDNLSEWGKKCLGVATEQADRLTDTATQLLDFEKADIGAEQPNFIKTDIISLIKRRVEAYESLAATKGIAIVTDFTPDEYNSEVDKQMLERVVDNLLSNAVKYSASGSKITISFNGGTQKWVLKVKDEGIGIPKKDQKKLFKEFYRAENAINLQVMGSGIGLLSVKRYVDIHGGAIKLESDSDKGTLFTIEVPLRLSCEDEIPITEEDNIKEVENKDIAMMSALSEGESEEKDMLVLIVEDNEILREFLVKALQTKFRIATSSDGQEAWEKIEEMQPDLVLSDVLMPRMDGFELCRLIKSTYSTSHIPVILLTALEDKDNQMRGLGLGADNYLVKPFDMELLAGRISSIINNRRNTARKALEAVKGDSKTVIVENTINDEFLKKAVECVKMNITDESFGKGDFASAMMISQSLLYKKIKSLTDMSVVEFIRSIRLKHALELLQSGMHNVTEVSEMCGFSTSAYFSRVFKEYFGKNPSEMIPKVTGQQGEE